MKKIYDYKEIPEGFVPANAYGKRRQTVSQEARKGNIEGILFFSSAARKRGTPYVNKQQADKLAGNLEVIAHGEKMREIIEKELVLFPPVVKTAICATAMNMLMRQKPDKELIQKMAAIDILLPSLTFYVFQYIMTKLPENAIIGEVFDVFSSIIKEENKKPEILH